MLHTPNYDTRSAFCGPTATGAVTGLPISLVHDAVREVSGRMETAAGAKHPVMGMRNVWLIDAMALLGWRIVEEGRPPRDRVYRLGHFCAARGRDGPFIVQLMGHYVAVGGGEICDTHTNIPLDIASYRGRMSRWVKCWWKFAPASRSAG